MWTWLNRWLSFDKGKHRGDSGWEARIAGLVQLLTELRLADPDCSLFGADAHRYTLSAPLSESRVSAFEYLYRFRLPEDYRAFLCHAGDGGAGPYYGLLSLVRQLSTEEAVTLSTPFPHTAAHVSAEEAPVERLTGCLHLSHHGCGYFDLLVVTGAARGQMWTVDAGSERGTMPLMCTFYEWYLGWIQRSLRTCYERRALGRTKQ
jgi:hypothetical protein